ncbi:hypothetical protein GOQ27_13245 [Clostridium sp. D2Q-11]|uniref:X-X-X-Leu-X-X-Gly heptad repeat-containing protein n=1 Tax=Anaeromonas frigoriresistens TaxID=2683708 RepID=A0A942ZA34_9FIRM|nr:hypothetical protein [Anaeromonas frigoriresistens]MBS4539435.1 hypothetical protein [Anaeromonas frigoriresistens]
MKKILSFILILTLLFTSGVSVIATDNPSSKEEVVYGLLNLDGSVNNLYVVNIFNEGTITDYGDYSNIRNMTTSKKINQKGEKITVDTKADKFYYQGTLEAKELPWDIAIRYFLDDKEISGTDLAGKSGKLKINMSVNQNTKINSNFFNNYALQISLSLDNKMSSDIKAHNATIAEAGGKKQISYTVLPGNSMDITVTADVQDFEMDAITVNGIKLSLGIDINPDEFTRQILELTDAIKDLDDGASKLLSGLNQLSSGMQTYVNGMKAFNEGIGQLPDSADMLNTGATGLRDGLSELTKQNNSLNEGALAIQQSTFDSVNVKLNQMGLGLPVLTAENYTEILSPIPDLAVIKEQLDGVVKFTQGLKGYTNGVEQLGKGASDLADGTSKFKSSSSEIASSSNELYNAGVELNKGIKDLHKGLATYREGTKKLKNGTSDMDSEINNQIDEVLGSISGSDDKVISFVSDKNTNVSAVQFVLKTDSITLPEVDNSIEQKSVELNFWEKLLDLFGLYK